MKYKVKASEGLMKITSSFCHCPGDGMGFHDELNAADIIDALYRAIEAMPVELSYDIDGEWIEVLEVDTGSFIRHVFTPNPKFEDYLGDQHYECGVLTGKQVFLEDEPEEGLPGTCRIISLQFPRIDYPDGSYSVIDGCITEFHPDWWVQSYIDMMCDDYLEEEREDIGEFYESDES